MVQLALIHDLTHIWNINWYAFPMYSTKLCLQFAWSLLSVVPSVSPNATGVLPRKIAAFTVTVAEVWFGLVKWTGRFLLPCLWWEGFFFFFLDVWWRCRSVRSRGQHLECWRRVSAVSLPLVHVTLLSWWCAVKHVGAPCGGADRYVCLENGCCDVWWSAGQL